MVKMNLCLHSDMKFVLLAIAVATLAIGGFILGMKNRLPALEERDHWMELIKDAADGIVLVQRHWACINWWWVWSLSSASSFLWSYVACAARNRSAVAAFLDTSSHMHL